MLDILLSLNLFWWLVLIITNFLFIILAYKLFGKWGLIAWSGVAIILANIQVIETVSLFGLVATLGNIIYGTTFLVTDLLNEKYSAKDAHRAVWFGFFSMIAATVIMQICLKFIPHSSDFGYPALETVFSLMPRIALGSLIAYLLSQNHDVWAFNFWKRKTGNKWLWFRNNASTITSQFIDSIVFCSIAFIGVFPWNIWFQILITTYFLKVIVAVCDTPFLYWGMKIHPLIELKESKNKV